YSFASIIVSAAAFGTLIADVPTGTIMIRLGLRRTMLIGSALVTLSTLLLAAPLNSDILLVLRLVAGVGTAFWGLSRYTFITQQVPPELRGRTIASFGGINRIGTFAGPLIAGSLVTGVGLSASFLLAGVLAALALVAAWVWIPAEATAKPVKAHDAPDTGELKGTWRALAGRRSDVFFASLAQVLAQVVRQGRQFLIPLYGVEVLGLDAFEVGIVMTTSAVIDMVMFGPAGYLMDRFGRKFATVPSFTIMALGIAMIPFADGFAGLLAAGFVIGLGNGIGSGTMMTLGADFAPAGFTSTFLSIWRFIGDSGQMIGPLLVGVVAQYFDLHQSAWVLSVCAVGCALMLFFLVRETRIDRSKPEGLNRSSKRSPAFQNQGG
ncbi:MAG TPA: MFS transporter, partial [Thermomicrobiales bacterium]|nr:MFS transporter [Thermomicrobiales bacterium]